MLLHRTPEAVGALDKAFSFDPGLSAETMAQLAFDYHRAGIRAAADLLFAEALRRRPDAPKTRFLRGWVAWEDGRKKAGKADLDEAVRSDPSLAQARDAVLNEKQQ